MIRVMDVLLCLAMTHYVDNLWLSRMTMTGIDIYKFIVLFVFKTCL